MKALQINSIETLEKMGISWVINFFKELARVLLFINLTVLSYLIPKSDNKVVFICNEAGSFAGNIKPLIQYALSRNDNVKIMIFTNNKDVYRELLDTSYNVFLYPCINSIWHLITSNKIVIENGMTIEKCGICFSAKVFQLWHGANLKYMVKQWDELRDRSEGTVLGKKLRDWKVNYPKYEFILAPSEFYKVNTFEKSFNSKSVYVAGYPRNDIFFREDTSLDFQGTHKSLIDKAIRHRESGGKVILYCPTWRDKACETEGVSPLTEKDLINFLEEKNILLVMKKHHRDRRNLTSTEHNLIEVYDHSLDVYPLMKHTDALISDYSSIFFDYLLLDKPVVFFPYDYNQYMTRDRLFQYDYNEFTPGKKCLNENELYSEVIEAMDSKNYYSEERERVKKIVFDSERCENSSQYIWEKILIS